MDHRKFQDHLIKLRQKAFVSDDTVRYRHYRNVVNRERKVIRGRYFASKVRQLKKTKPSQWWGAVKRIAGMVPAMGSESLFSQLHIEGYDSLPPQDIANRINNAFLEPREPFQCLETPAPFEEDPIVFNISETAVLSALKKLNPHKVSGPDGIPNWLMREYAEILAPLVSSVYKSPSWKQADVVPIPKLKPVSNVNKHLRPISLTPVISKIAEDFVVSIHVDRDVLKEIDLDQFGAIPNSSTVQTLMSMLHHWTKATDGCGAAVRIVLFDYKKAFDLIDHHLLVRNIYSLYPFPMVWHTGWLTSSRIGNSV